MGLRDFLFVAACAFTAGTSAADTQFSKPEYRVTLPGAWKETSDREMDAFTNAAGTRELTASFMTTRQPLDQSRLREIIATLLEQRARAHRELSGASAKLEQPVISRHGRFIRGQLWGTDGSGRNFATVIYGDSGSVRSFSYVGVGTQAPAFRSEAIRVFDGLELK